MQAEMSRIMMAFYGMPWAILPGRFEIMRSVLHRWESGIKLSADDLRVAVGDAPQVAEQRQQQAQARAALGVAVIPVYGLLAPRIHMVSSISGEGAMSYERLTQSFRKAMNDPSVGAIVFDVDSPGGSATGIQELADEVYAARSQKKIVAVANSLAASGAFWLASAAEEIVATPSAEIGSVGVFGAHEDHSVELEKAGIKVELISAGKYKTEGHPYGPLTDETRAHLQSEVNRIQENFHKALARNFGKSVAGIKEAFGAEYSEGRMAPAVEAVKRGMAHRIGTLDETIARLSKSKRAQYPRQRQAAKLGLAELG